MDELKYSIAEKKNIEGFEKAKVMTMVSVREGGKYTGTLVLSVRGHLNFILKFTVLSSGFIVRNAMVVDLSL